MMAVGSCALNLAPDLAAWRGRTAMSRHSRTIQGIAAYLRRVTDAAPHRFPGWPLEGGSRPNEETPCRA
jgi:hypothetical protein